MFPEQDEIISKRSFCKKMIDNIKKKQDDIRPCK